MFKALRYFIVIAFLAGGAAWLADLPGSVHMQWGDYEIETSFGVMAIAAGSLAVLSALLYRTWLFLRFAPRNIRGAWRSRRQNRGYRALTRGMVAVAAGDSAEARKQARKAEDLLNEPPLTMLLSAQAAQLNGDERAAERFFRAMTGNRETEFLGLRGLLNQATKRGDADEALALTRRAHRLHPDSDWVSQSLFELQTQAGQWLDAHVTVKEAVRNRHMDAATGKRHQAVLTYQMSLDAAEKGDRDQAVEYARDALTMAPGFVPAAISVAATLIAAGKRRKAAGIIEKIWVRSPHPDLTELYMSARGAVEALERVKVAEKLHAATPDHVESNIAVAQAALTASLWGKARDHLARAGAGGGHEGVTLSARVCRLMAELEEAEHKDTARARQWLVRASLADPDPAWVCGSCGHTVTDWAAICGNCGAFDGYAWGTPPHVPRLSASPDRTSVAPEPLADTVESVAVVVPESERKPEARPPVPAEG